MNNEEFAQRIIESGTFNVAAANSLSIRMSPNGRAQYTGSADDESSRVVDVITTYYRDVYVDAMGQERTCISMTI